MLELAIYCIFINHWNIYELKNDTHEINCWPTEGFLPYAGLTESRWQVEEADRLCNTPFLQEDKSWR